MRRMILPLLFGIAGTAVLVSLGVWQLQRLDWKEGVLAEIEARIGDAPVAIPAEPDPEAHRFMPVAATGRVGDETLRVLISLRGQGAGYRLISAFETDGRRVLIDRGFLPDAAELPNPPDGEVTITGNLHWPDDLNSSTPQPDIGRNIWFARDLPAMAELLDTEPVLVVLRTSDPVEPALAPLPVTTEGIPNDHLEYAGTWFSLAAAWAGMTLFLLWRIRRRTT